jgi:hypothetical protein
VATDSEEWRQWIEDHGNHGVLHVKTVEMLPPGLKEALEFESFQLFLPSHAMPTIAADQDGCVEVRVNAGLVAEETVEAGTIQRVIRTGGETKHVLFGLPKRYWNRGNARRMLTHAVALYDQLGVETIELRAVGLGKYIWAVAGFDFKDDQTREAVNTAMQLFARELDLFDGELPTFQHPWEVLALDLDDDAKPRYVEAEKVAQVLEERGEVRLIEGFRPGRLAVSKALYLYSRYDSWDGTMNLEEGSPSRTQFERAYKLP